jgi:hypothetical protein
MDNLGKSKRAERRHHSKRMKEKARRFARQDGYRDPENMARLHNHLASCSCYACGNPRKHWNEPTIQERRQDAVLKEAREFGST